MKSKIIQLLALLAILAITSGCDNKKDIFRIGVIQWTEIIQPYTQTYKGLLDSLNDKGYLEGMNVELIYRNVEQDKTLALEIARQFVSEEVDVIVALGTGSSFAALEATEHKAIPIVFSIVGSPKATGIIKDYKDTGRNITGVSMRIPVKEQFSVIQEILPDMQNIGIMYYTEMAQAVATGKEAIATSTSIGWTPHVIAISPEELPRLKDSVQELADKVDAIYIPTDPVLSKPEHLKTIVEVADNANIPIIGVARHFVQSGILAAVHCDFYEIGRQAGEPIDQLLNGVDIRNIPAQLPIVKRVSLNLNKAKQLNIDIKRNTILKADNIFE